MSSDHGGKQVNSRSSLIPSTNPKGKKAKFSSILPDYSSESDNSPTDSNGKDFIPGKIWAVQAAFGSHGTLISQG